MPDKLKKQERQMMLWESDDRIVPLKSADQSDGSKLGNSKCREGGQAITRAQYRAHCSYTQTVSIAVDTLDWNASRNVAETPSVKRSSIICYTTDGRWICSTMAFCKTQDAISPPVSMAKRSDHYGDRTWIVNLARLARNQNPPRQSYRPQPQSCVREIPKENGKTQTA